MISPLPPSPHAPALGPLVIGAMGGSGTRLVATLAIAMGADLGDDLNGSMDNLWATALLKQPPWAAPGPDPNVAAAHLDILLKVLAPGPRPELTASESAMLDRLEARLNSEEGRHSNIDGDVVRRLRHHPPRPEMPSGLWGWKEPNSQVFIDILSQRLPGLRYIQVLRHPLDMAFSGNRQQLNLWGPWLLGEAHRPNDPEPVQMLRYWVASTMRALHHARALPGDQAMVLNYDRLVTSPSDELKHMARFLNHEGDIGDLLGLISPQSVGRHHAQDLSLFPPALVALALHIFETGHLPEDPARITGAGLPLPGQ